MTLQLTEELRVGLLEDAYRRGYDYLPKWGACAPTTFAAIMDTLGYADDQLARDIWKATVGLTGGTGNMAIGTCGAMAGAAAAISFSFGFTREDVEQDNNKMILINKAVASRAADGQAFQPYCVSGSQLRNWGKPIIFEPRCFGEFSKWR